MPLVRITPCKQHFLLTMVKILEASVNPAINLDSWYMLITSYTPLKKISRTQGFRVPSLEIDKLIKVPDFFHNPELHLEEIKSTYQEMRADSPRLRQCLAELDGQAVLFFTQADSSPTDKTKLFHKFQVAYGVLLTIATALNSILRTLNPDDFMLLEEAHVFTSNAIKLARDASRYRPLGGGFIPQCLAAIVSVSTSQSTFANGYSSGLQPMEY